MTFVIGQEAKSTSTAKTKTHITAQPSCLALILQKSLPKFKACKCENLWRQPNMILAFIPYIVLCAIHRDTPPGLPLIHERAGNTLIFFSPICYVYSSCICGHLYPNVFLLHIYSFIIGSFFVSFIALAFAEAHYWCICIRDLSHNTRAAPTNGSMTDQSVDAE